MRHSIHDIAKALGAKALGATDISVTGVAEPAMAGPDHLALAMKPEFAAGLVQGHARAALVWDGADWQGLGLEAAIIAPRPRYAMAGLSAMMDPGQGFAPGVHPTAVIDPTAEVADDASIGPLSVIGPRARIGAGAVIGPQCFVGADAVLGQGAYLREGVRIGARVTIGERFIAQPGATVGADGYSFVTPEQSSIERVRDSLGDQGEITAQAYARIHSLGNVTIGDDVELGANSCIDRGTVRDTQIGNGVKFDNLAQIGHNVVIGNDCLICGLVGVAGSTRIGNNVVLGGQTGVSDNLFIGDNVITGGATKVLANVPAGRVMMGYPAMKMDTHIETYKALRRLPRLMKQVAALQKAVFKPGQSD
ncbi:UDP-3-O-(3-hydroxymyristoyl)glucosamine N-acyltransferase [Lutimaribacter sp. EGI FJ00015]|uniref:UDP-3-O-(3-hydroxymyristoyl)glucosamine N-acyltransferase n=1 Tax=Lutimaribacter degradans TaxID=2945989 RepID=A0ACC5ZW79_9RHOB|nr:UDP-3-O-(3-hydroxymyristoyl)glucosamine N-acyltransferase [Lutimaribacter sp. EGI FJ00013]MCM2562203.1 UDP-3-O-(3-hydroxymyristoyl)glucosamine N-acyltransferase [Lutimaribacter sp. EGI FJ00013]MCO0613358.1 UDP-3-O-(3-hydroxymyristoyl)glucosamine N-acyltransferase [Lutimaribacter sp. EGI FJ00015]MCO0636332.1 UDP-3-O-(3-hydroxymyristoyl)glucosamine N-acyltransferase [Lutimaribacter sp. EGI FJ00014]